ncbi:MAG TPA: glycosyltransferase family 2 protein [Candidatus Hydrogenedentes bacterium]|nr:glycosyltransferase family 2 protein [Candidatus Hydrogenedentota bacterium]HIJ74750.1 glycosyltransferase family 2 protein [Candidatus Hydrogenedentota bacterium]
MVVSETTPSEKHIPPNVSFVVIGYNEATSLKACLGSIQGAEMPAGVSSELIYVDGGSKDDSIGIAEGCAVDLVLGGERRRKAAENRNLGLAAARGRYVQFIDSDMTLASDWPKAAMTFLDHHAEAAAVCGNLHEVGTGAFARALEIDWGPREGPIRHCGGAAMYRRETLVKLGGFPENVEYGEEPYLCWRVRNELQQTIHQLGRKMADHALGYRRFMDYWRRNLRMGATYAEIAARCCHSPERLWLKETAGNVAWMAAALICLAALIAGPVWLKLAAVLFAGGIVLRKCIQAGRRGYALPVAAAYAVHTYAAKVPLGLGTCLWLVRRHCLGAKRRSS